MALSVETVQEVQRTANIYDVISDYLTLRKVGSNYITLCPFHQEKTPSFVVSPSKNIFKCFGCGISGDAIKFVMEYEKLSFTEAILKLASKYGIKVRYIGSDKYTKLKPIFDITEKLKDFYIENLMHDKTAKSYIENRGIMPSAVKHFEIGFSPKDSSKILNFLKSNNIQIEKLVDVGLLTRYKDGTILDKFFGRIVFPIRDTKGNVVAFGGRALEKDVLPKYLNSPESYIYQKGKVLYGLFNNIDYIKEKYSVVVVEGYIDLISLWQIGIRNVVATLGTALTQYHAKLLIKYVKDVYLMFDSDDAGKKATIEAAKNLIAFGIVPKVIIYNEFKDPDEMAKAGIKVVLDKIEKATDVILYTLSRIKQTKSIDSPQERLNIYTKLYKIIIDLLANIKDPDIRYSYITVVCEELNIPIINLQRDIEEKADAISRLNVDSDEEGNFLHNLSLNEKAILKTAFENPYLLKNCNFCDKINISPILRYYFDLILTQEDSEEYDIIKNQIQSIEHKVAQEIFYQELMKIHEKRTKHLEKESFESLVLPEEEKLKVIYEKISKKSLKGGYI